MVFGRLSHCLFAAKCLGLSKLKLLKCKSLPVMHCRHLSSMSQKEEQNPKQKLFKPRAWQIFRGVVESLHRDTFHQDTYKPILALQGELMQSQNFKTLSKLHSLKTNDLNQIRLEITQLDADQLMSLATDIAHLKNKTLQKQLIEMAEKEVCSRIKQFSLVQLLYFADVLYRIQLIPNVFYRNLFRYVEHNWNHMEPTPQNIVQLLFYISLVRDAPSPLLSNVELYLNANVGHLNGNELSLVCFAFFVTNRAMWNINLLNQIASQSLDVVKDLKLQYVANILKALRHANYKKSTFYEEVGNILCLREDITANNLGSLANVASTYASVRVKHTPLFEALSQSLEQALEARFITRPRQKDLVRLCWSFSMLVEELPMGLLAQLMRKALSRPEFQREYPESFVEGLVALALQGIYPEELIGLCLEQCTSPGWKGSQSKRRLAQQWQLLFLDSILEVCCDKYSGYRLTQMQRKRFQNSPEVRFTEMKSRAGLCSTWLELQALLGNPSHVSCHSILPFTNIPDLEVQMDVNGNPIKLLSDVQLKKQLKLQSALNPGNYMARSGIKAEPTEGILSNLLREAEKELSTSEMSEHKRVAFKVLGWNQYLLNTPEPHGVIRKELELLKKMGYTVYAINPYDAVELDHMNSSERTKYVKNILDQLGIKT